MCGDVIEIRAEEPGDIAGVRAVNEAAFPTSAEADLVDALRDAGAHEVSLVAVEGDRVVGHILFSPATIEAEGESIDAIGLAPMSVVPALQRGGIGSRLVREGLARCEALGHRTVIVLGHAAYYPRFGFLQADEFNLRCEFPSPPESFMVRGYDGESFGGRPALARYHAAFNDL